MTTLSAALVLSACSDDGGGDEAGDPSSSEASGSATPSDGPLEIAGTDCRADVKVAGASTDSWTGKGNTSVADGVELYRASKGKNQWLFLNVREDGSDLVVGIAGKNYPAKPTDIEIESTDAGVEATATVPVKGGEATVTATFACADD